MNTIDESIVAADEHILLGLDGGNPLAFLAALGTLRALTLARPDMRPMLSWRQAGAWRPVLHFDQLLTRQELVDALAIYLATMRGHDVWSLGPDLSVSPAAFRTYAAQAAVQAYSGVDRTWADFAAAFGCEVTTTDAGTIQDTALRTMSGAGHQHFLQFMATIIAKTGRRGVALSHEASL